MFFVRVLTSFVVISLYISSANAEAEEEYTSTVIPQPEMCNVTNPCENGGKCVQNMCNCLEGTSGHLCKVIDDCSGSSMCGEADCLYNVTSQEIYCKCRNTSLDFNDVTKTCEECDCGTYQRRCSFVQGNKKCDCMDKYADKRGICTYCDCGENGNCRFHIGFLKTCECLDGYGIKNRTCTECMCGNNTGCTFDETSNQKICYCRAGFQLKDGVCTECDCGNGLCKFDKRGRKECVCNVRSAEWKGTCKKCECEDDNAKCSFEYDSGEKRCYCLDGYKTKNKTCTECNCGSNAYCSHSGTGEKHCACSHKSVLIDGICRDCDCGWAATRCLRGPDEKFCLCLGGFADNSGTCDKCDCGVHATNCAFEGGEQKCTCKDGYADARGLCTDCNCGSNGTCSLGDFWGKLGYEGTKTCQCDPGYVEYEGKCRDICDETKCNSGVCIVTGLNYTCICNAGFTGLHCDERITKIGHDVLSASIIVFILLCIVGFFIGTLCLIRRNRNLKKFHLQQIKDTCQR